METLKNKIDFMIIFTAEKCNPNGDPLMNGRPRIDSDGYGEVSSVSLKRKIRNRLQDMGERIFVQSDERCEDGYKSLLKRAFGLKPFLDEVNKKEKADIEICRDIVCKEWIDVRAFGQVFPIKKAQITFGIRGPVSIGLAKTIETIDIEEMPIVKSVNTIDEKNGKDSSTMGVKYVVNKAAYVAKGSIFPDLAAKTGFSEEDAELIKRLMITIFENDASAARPSGSMNVTHMYWWRHPGRQGLYPSGNVFRTIELQPITGFPYYSITENQLKGLEPEVYIGC